MNANDYSKKKGIAQKCSLMKNLALEVESDVI